MSTLAVAEVRASSITALVRRATRRARVVTASECLALGLAVVAVVAAGERLRGLDELARGELAAAALAGVAAGATWWLERRPTAHDVARRVDRVLARDGEFVTAYELEGRERGVIEELLLLRARSAVEPRAVARSVPPPSVVFAGAALCALAGWLFAREAVLVRAPTALETLANDARDFATSAASKPGSPELERARAAVARASVEIARASETRSRPEPELVASLAAALDRVARADGENPERADRARSLAERARDAAARARAAAGSAETSSANADSDPTLANGDSNRTMSRPGSAADVAGEASSGSGDSRNASAPITPNASFAGRWWSARHDAVVAAWIEARRSRASESPNETTRRD